MKAFDDVVPYLVVFNNGSNIAYCQSARINYSNSFWSVCLCAVASHTSATKRNSICVRILCHSPNHNQMLTNGNRKIKCE